MDDRAAAIWVEVTATRGSAPRDPGTAMKVTATDISGTIGGGALELGAIKKARNILAQTAAAQTETIPLGPDLGQCCGGAVTLRYDYQPRTVDAVPEQAKQRNNIPQTTIPLWLWGAGHVGRAVVQTAQPDAFKIIWIDSAFDRFPDHVPVHATATPAADMPLLATRAPLDAHHLIFTYSHDIDLALCAALLQRGAASIGLIGSDTKWARFSKRLAALGLDPAQITCPIGDKTLGKAPYQIAHGTVRALLACTTDKVYS
ncbi:MAG: xanthine dehydrogenase accessory protein XdhC [Sulfitobacter sp.]